MKPIDRPIARGDHIELVSRHDGTRLPGIVTTPPTGCVIQVRLAGAPVGTPIRLEHWQVVAGEASQPTLRLESAATSVGEVATWVGVDGTPVVQIDTYGGGRVRVNLNDAPIWDGDPETDAAPGQHLAHGHSPSDTGRSPGSSGTL